MLFKSNPDDSFLENEISLVKLYLKVIPKSILNDKDITTWTSGTNEHFRIWIMTDDITHGWATSFYGGQNTN